MKRPEAQRCIKCFHAEAKGSKHSCWKGGRIRDRQGYIRVYAPEDERANCGRYMKEHTLVMEQMLGRRLMKGETVHHKNGDRSDNRAENLELWNHNHPLGQRVEDKVRWAREILILYGEDFDHIKNNATWPPKVTHA